MESKAAKKFDAVGDMRKIINLMESTQPVAEKKHPPAKFKEGQNVTCKENGRCQISGLNGWTNKGWFYKLKTESGDDIDNIPQSNLRAIQEDAADSGDEKEVKTEGLSVGEEVCIIGESECIGTIHSLSETKETAYITPAKENMSVWQNKSVAENGAYAMPVAELAKYNKPSALESFLNQTFGTAEPVVETRKPGEFRPGDSVALKNTNKKAFAVVDKIMEGEVWVTMNEGIKLADVKVVGLCESDIGQSIWFNPDELELVEYDNLPVPSKQTLPVHKQEFADEDGVFAAVRNGDTAYLNNAAMNGLHMNIKDGRGRNPLHVAAGSDHRYVVSVIDALLQGDAFINELDNSGNRPLDYAKPGSEAYNHLKKKKAVSGDTALMADGTPAEVGMHVDSQNGEYLGQIVSIKQGDEEGNFGKFTAVVDNGTATKNTADVSTMVKNQDEEDEFVPVDRENVYDKHLEGTEFPTIEPTETENISESQRMRNMLNMITEKVDGGKSKV